MKSSFFEYNVAITGMNTARAGLNTIGHNMANASAVGYSRQYIEQRASWPMATTGGRGMVGTGSDVYGINQVRNFYLDKKYWKNVSTLGEYSAKSTQLSLTQSVMDEMGGTGLRTQFTDFFSRLHDLTTTAGDTTYRTNLLQLSDSISTYFGNTYESLLKQQSDINEEIRGTVTIINSFAQQIATLNQQISQFELSGSKANDLRDQRARLVDQLSVYANVEVKEVERNADYAAGKYPNPEDRGKSDLRFTVMLNGVALVDHYEYNMLEVKERKYTKNGENIGLSSNPEDAPGLYDIYWKNTGTKFNMYSSNLTGELKALIDLRDGNNQNYLDVSGSSVDSYTYSGGSRGVLTLDLDPNTDRVDLSSGGGVIKVLKNGVYSEYTYSSYKFNPATGKAEFTIVDPDPAALSAANFDGANTSITVGKTSDYKGIPYYLSRLNDLARGFVKAINEGKRMDGSFIEGVIGHLGQFANGPVADTSLKGAYNNAGEVGENLPTLFFTYVDSVGNEKQWDGTFNIYELTAYNLKVNNELMKHPELMQLSDAETGGVSNNQVGLSFLKINTDRSLFLEGTLGDYITSVSGEMGIQTKQAVNFTASYTDLTVSIDNQRMSVSGVDLDEEAVNMIRYNTQFQAAAKLMNIIDGIYDTMINRLGLG